MIAEIVKSTLDSTTNPSRAKIIVKCPYCSKRHQHYLSGNEIRSGDIVYRASDCNGEDYEISTMVASAQLCDK